MNSISSKRRARSPWTLALAFAIAAPLAAGDWNQFRGPARDGTTSAAGLASSWEAGAPRELWRRPIGAGYSTIAAVEGRLYTMAVDDENGEAEKVLCLDAATGETIWERSIGPGKESDLGDSGPRSTPTVDGELLYTASSAGRLVALSTADGSQVWAHDFPGAPPRFGYSVSPLVDGDLLIVESGAGADDPGVLAFDKRSGELRWSALAGPAGYSSPIAVEIAGVRQYVFYRRVGNAVVSVSTQGEPLWEHPTAALAVITTPIFLPPDRLFVASADDAMGGAMLRVVGDAGEEGDAGDAGFRVEEVWHQRLMRNHFNSSVLVGRHLYGFDNGTFRCLDAETGERLWAKRGFGKGSLVAAGTLLYVLGDGGVLALVEATPEEFRELGRVTAMKGRAWSSPSLADGRLYLRDFDEVVAFDVRVSDGGDGGGGGGATSDETAPGGGQ